MGLAPSERASKIISVNFRDHSFDELGPEISWVKGGPGTQSGGWGLGQSGAPLSPGGECFAPLGPEISQVKGGPGLQSGGWGPGQSGAPCRPGGECFAPLAQAVTRHSV